MPVDYSALLDQHRGRLSHEEALGIVWWWASLSHSGDLDAATALASSVQEQAPALIDGFGIPVILEAIRRYDEEEPGDGEPPLAFMVGDIIAGRFPYSETPDEPGATRPCVVVGVNHAKGTVTVAFGSDIVRTSNRGVDFEIATDEDMRAAGLDKPTRFSMHRLAEIPLNRRFIDYRNGGRFGRVPNHRRAEFDDLRREGIERSKDLKFALGMMLFADAEPNHVVVEAEEGFFVLRHGEITIEFWISDPEHFDSITPEAIRDAPFLSAIEKMRLLSAMTRPAAE